MSRLAISTVLIVLTMLASAYAKPWWPVFKPEGGGYCGQVSKSMDQRESRTRRDGAVKVEVRSRGLDVRLGTKQKSFKRGEVVYARIENLGTINIFDTPSYQVELLVGADWERVGPSGLGWPRLPPPIIQSGWARCFNFQIPKQAQLGHYRVVKLPEYGDGAIGERSTLTLVRRFRVND